MQKQLINKVVYVKRIAYMVKYLLISMTLGFATAYGAYGSAPLSNAAKPQKLSISQQAEGMEAYLEVNHRISCGGPNSRGLPGIPVLIQDSNSKDVDEIRFDIFEGKPRTLIALGSAANEREIQVQYQDPLNPNCVIHNLEAKIIYKNLNFSKIKNDGNFVSLLALKHSPFLVVREDQYTNRSTDIPLEMVFNITRNSLRPNELTIRYTVFFSDEDSKDTSSELEGQMARYGRTTDIEWIYEITLNENGEVVKESYQGGVLDKLSADAINSTGDHSELVLRSSQYYPGTQHRILYNKAKNNVFSDEPDNQIQKEKYLAYHLSPEVEVTKPHARESFQLNQASYMYLVSEKELELENKKIASLEDYLFVEVWGTLSPSDTIFNANNGAFKMKFEVTNERTQVQSIAYSKRSVDRLGEDMFGTVAIPALVVGRKTIQDLLTKEAIGNITFHDARNIGFSGISITQTKLSYLEWNQANSRYERKQIPYSVVSSSKQDGFKQKIFLNFQAE